MVFYDNLIAKGDGGTSVRQLEHGVAWGSSVGAGWWAALLETQVHLLVSLYSSGPMNVIQIRFIGFKNQQTFLAFIGLTHHEHIMGPNLTWHWPLMFVGNVAEPMDRCGKGTCGVTRLCSSVTWQPTNISGLGNWCIPFLLPTPF
jgi:hypothetical protein